MTARLAHERERRAELLSGLRAPFDAGFDHDAWLAACARASALEKVAWNGALFNRGEVIGRPLPPADEPEAYILVSGDGSQIMPDRHKPVPYYLIQIGGVCLVYGRSPDSDLQAAIGRAEERWVELVSDPARLYGADRDGELVSASDISTERDLREIEWLAERCEDLGRSGLQVIAVADGQIVPFALLNDRLNERRRRELLDRVTRALERARRSGAWLAGYIDRPGSAAVARACALANIPHDSVSATVLGEANTRLAGVFDRHVFESVLASGQRSAAFSPTWRVNDALGRHAMVACYLNVSDISARSSIARLEFPAWCSAPDQIDRVCGAMVRHAAVGGGWPLILKLAHEAARVSEQDQHDIDEWVQRGALEAGLLLSESAKQASKDLL